MQDQGNEQEINIKNDRGFGGVLSFFALRRFQAKYNTARPNWKAWSEPPYTTKQMQTVELRFAEGQRVACWMPWKDDLGSAGVASSAGRYTDNGCGPLWTHYAPGTVVKCWYREDSWKSQYWAAYQVVLDDDGVIYVSLDDPFMVRSLGVDPESTLIDPRYQGNEPQPEPEPDMDPDTEQFVRFCDHARVERTKLIRHNQCKMCDKVDIKQIGQMVDDDPGIIPFDPADLEFAALQKWRQFPRVKLFKCAGCKGSANAPKHCSKECQAADWNLHHKRECLGRSHEKTERARLERLANDTRTEADKEATARELMRRMPGEAPSTRRA